jgi:hypothetical protein
MAMSMSHPFDQQMNGRFVFIVPWDNVTVKQYLMRVINLTKYSV